MGSLDKRPFADLRLHYNPSVSLAADSSLYTREPLVLSKLTAAPPFPAKPASLGFAGGPGGEPLVLSNLPLLLLSPPNPLCWGPVGEPWVPCKPGAAHFHKIQKQKHIFVT